jgi:anti-sigma B factor antagonist
MTSALGRNVFPCPEMRPFLRQPCAANAAVPAVTGGAQMPEGSFPVEVVEGVPVVAAPEEIDVTNADALRSALLQAAGNGHGRLVVDMTQTQFCDSSGLHTLLAAHKRADAEGRKVLLVIPSATVLRIFALTGIDTVIPNFASLPEALAQTGHDDHLSSPAHRARPRQATVTGISAPASCSGLDR